MSKLRLVSLVLLVGASASAMAGPTLKLCTARPDGVYHAAGKTIQQAAKADGISIELVESEGSLDNLNRMVARGCDGAIIQADAYLVFQKRNPEKHLSIQGPLPLYEEHMHLVCRRDTGIERVEDLLGSSAHPWVMVGEPFSGSSVTWRSLQMHKPVYLRVSTQELGGAEALNIILRGNQGQCLFQVSGLGSKFLQSVDAKGDQLRLVQIDDDELNGVNISGKAVYALSVIPGGTYPRMQADVQQGFETLTVRAGMVVSTLWANINADAWDRLQRAVEKVRPDIEKQASGR